MNDERTNHAGDAAVRPGRQQSWVKTFSFCAVVAAIYGGAIGANVTTQPQGLRIVLSGAVIMALLLGVASGRYGRAFGQAHGLRFIGLLVGAVSVAIGGIVGGLFAVAALTPVGALVGAIGGGVVGRYTAASQQRSITTLLGVFVGICAGALVQIFRQHGVAAHAGTLWGAIVGAGVGPLLIRLLVHMVNSLPGPGRTFPMPTDPPQADANPPQPTDDAPPQ